MSKQRYLEFTASFLVVLVLTIPFYVASVYATISKITVKGGDGIEGYAKVDDFLGFNVHASISDDTITNDQVVLGGSIQFDKCTPSINNGSDCTLRHPSEGTQAFEAKIIPFTINLFKDDKTLDDSKSGSFAVDNKAPEINLYVSKSKFSSADKIIVSYSVADTACDDPSCAGLCVGIKNVRFFTLDGAFDQNVDVQTSTCNFASEISIEPQIFSDGINSVFAKATDKFGQSSPDASVTFSIDTSAPIIIADSFYITRKSISLSTFSLFTIDAVVWVNISADDLDIDSVTADLSELNPKLNLTKAKASCTAFGDSYTCSWSIQYIPGTEGTKTITFNAADTLGNTESTAITKSLTLDDKGPVALSLSTTAARNGKAIAKPSGNTVIAAFDEATGLSADEVFLHVNGVGTTATSCSKGIGWSCKWNDVDFGSSNSTMSIEPDTTDVLGNAVDKPFEVEVIVDDAPPVLNTINITNVGGLVPAFPGFFKIGDKIFVIANLTEDNDVFATADFSKFISDAYNIAGSCERIQADEHVCTWLTDSINLQASDVITFNFSDNAGNTLIVTKSLKTYGLENATVPDFWSSTVECSPKTIDRSLGPLINQRVFCQVALTPKSTTKQVSTVFISPATCTGGASVVDSVNTFNTEVGSTSPIVKITLKKDDFKINSASLKCSLNIFSKIGGSTTITQNPEIENVNINISFFNLPLGEVSEEVQRKIDDAKEDAEGIWSLIGTLNKLVFYAKRICQIINTIYNVVAVLYFAYFVLKGAEFTCTAAGGDILFGICNSIYAMAVGQCQGTEAASAGADSIKKASNWACDIVNCRKGGFLWGPLVKDFINDPTKSLGSAGYLFSPGQYVGTKTDGTNSAFNYISQISIGVGGKPRPVSEYMDPQRNLIVATLFECLPGIIYGLDKYRQIKCLYADCLQNAVGNEGLPVTACEDQKAYATCKYVTGELFAVFPWTAVFNHFMTIIKNALSNPFSALGVAVALACPTACYVKADGGLAYKACRFARLFTLVGDAAQNVKDIIDTGFTIRTDYCERLEKND